MDGLRWLLLLFGLFVVVGVYIYTRYQRGRTDDSPRQGFFGRRIERSAKGEAEHQPDAPPEQLTEAAHSDQPGPAPAQKIVTLRIVARNHGAFPGDELVLSLRGIGLRHGKFGIFHRYEGNDEDRVVFSAASLVEPGSFDMANIREQQIPGISLFMVLPGPIEGAQAFDLMIVAARALSQSLNAELLDESGSTLSIQRERFLREEIIHFEHSAVVA